MALRQYRPLLAVVVCALVFYAVNTIVFRYPPYNVYYKSYHHSLEVLYLFFMVLSLVVTTAIIVVHKKSLDNTGFAFIGATLFQMVLCYFMLHPVLEAENNRFEKIHFFIIFLLFLSVETLVTIRLLNKKQ